MIRLFAALAVPEDIVPGLQRLQRGLPGARWRPAESLHITLRFFGEITEDRADDLDAELAVIGGGPLTLGLAGVGAFSDAFGEAQSVWAGVEAAEPLRRLAARCETAARRARLKPDTRAFRPHVTLAYLRHAEPAKVAAWVAAHNLLKSPPFRVEGFGLYSSWRTDEGSVYRLERLHRLC